MSELIEDPKYFTYSISPDLHDGFWLAYKKAQELFWPEEDIDGELKKDEVQWPLLDEKIKHFLMHIIAFFVIGDGKVNENIQECIDSRITMREISIWYNLQKAMEDIHNIVYSKLAATYVKDPKERQKIFNAVENFPIINLKINWVRKWLGEGNPFHKIDTETLDVLKSMKDFNLECLRFIRNISDSITGLESDFPDNFSTKFESWINVAKKMEEPKPLLARQILVNIIMEGLFFTGSFCSIFWINHVYGKLPGLTKANELISRDEGMHTDYGINLYKYKIKHKLPQNTVHTMFHEAVDLESEFIAEALPNDLLNMNTMLMTQYIEFVADQLLVKLGYDKLYYTTMPSGFDFMNKQSISVRITDFFIDYNVTEYGISSSNTVADDQEIYVSDSD